MSGSLRYIFRGLGHDRHIDVMKDGLVARNPRANAELTDQINSYETGRGTQFISTSRSFLAAAYFATDRGTKKGCVVKIDLTRIPKSVSVYDLSHEKLEHWHGPHGPEVGTKLWSLAVEHGEVLLEGKIPAEAVVRKFPVDMWAGQEGSLDDFIQQCSQNSLSWVSKKIYGAKNFYVEGESQNGSSKCHLGPDCEYADGNLRSCTELPHRGVVCVRCLHAGVQAVNELRDCSSEASGTNEGSFHNTLKSPLRRCSGYAVPVTPPRRRTAHSIEGNLTPPPELMLPSVRSTVAPLMPSLWPPKCSTRR